MLLFLIDTSLYLNENFLTGTIVTEIGDLQSLEYLDLSDNALGGTLPNEFNDLRNLRTMKINRSRGGLGGSLPSFGGLVRIELLELAYNLFTGEIPHNLFDQRPRNGDIRVRLASNLLQGSLSDRLGEFQHMILEIEDNQITGLPKALCNQKDWVNGETAVESCNAILCPNGTWSPSGRASATSGKCELCPGNVYFGQSTCAVGSLDDNSEVQILDSLFLETGGWYWKQPHTNWTKAGVPICYREGILCGWKPTDMNSGVTELRLDEFGLRGRIPTDVFQLPLLRRLLVSNNKVEVTFDGIEQAKKLEVVTLTNTNTKSLEHIQKAAQSLRSINLAGSNLTGTFPSELLQLSLLISLQLDNNHFSGPIPSEISSLSKLNVLNLSDNFFSGTIPSELSRLEDLKELQLNNNRLSGAMPTELQNLPILERLSVSSQTSENKISGPLLSFSSVGTLRFLNMSSNAISGTVPESLRLAANKHDQIVIDLSKNELHGGVPRAFGAFQQLTINLAGNKIEELPSELCDNTEWMGGITGVVVVIDRCDSILCSPGTFTATGRQMHRDDACVQCDSFQDAPYFGSIACVDPRRLQEREGKRNQKVSTVRLVTTQKLTGVA